MNSRALRRLVGDHGALHKQDLPPNYLFPSSDACPPDDLTQLDILLAGPPHTPFAAGVWKLHLTMPPTYPQQPPTAHFRTPIFHPNVDPQTGAVCVETLKRDWDSRLTLRDVLITISCLLIQPNPDSALNADAGALVQESYAAFERRAKLMTSIHAVVPKALQAAVLGAQNRGQEVEEEEGYTENSIEPAPEAHPIRRRRTIAKVRGSRREAGSPSAAPSRTRQQPVQEHPWGQQRGDDDVFGITNQTQSNDTMGQIYEDSEVSMDEGEQENDASMSPPKSATPAPTMTPRRPRGVAVPLGELIMEQEESSSDMEPEYPPSPRKSPSKSPSKPQDTYDSRANIPRPESSQTPQLHEESFGGDSFLMDVTFEHSPPQRTMRRGLFGTPPVRPQPGANLFGDVKRITPEVSRSAGVRKTKSPSSAERKHEERHKQAELESKLWMLCGGDIKRWNRGDFGGVLVKKKAARW